MKRSRLIIGLVVAVVVLVSAWGWFLPVGTGEYAESPDGRFTAHASNLRRGTWLHGRVSYIEVKIEQNSTGSTVWKADRFPLADEVPPDFGDRSRRFIVWAPDSRSVSVPVGGTADAVFVVP